MLTKVMDAAPPTRKYEIMSGSTKAALKASASVPLPKSHAMYLVRTSPITLESAVEIIRITVAENAECACVGRRAPSTRAMRDRYGVGGASFTQVDSNLRRLRPFAR